MSVELPEAHILCKQMNKELAEKEIVSYILKDCTKFQNLGFINMYEADFDRLQGGKIESVVCRGNVIRVKLDNGLNLLLAPGYGGKILFKPKTTTSPPRFHLKVSFKDGSSFTVTLTGMGVIKALTDDELKQSYVYQRDFSTKAYPISEEEFEFEQFSKGLSAQNANIKTAIVGKDALVVGLGNSAFQDILYRAKIHPKRKASSLNEAEKRALYDAILGLVKERIRLGGKSQFVDFYDRQGAYVALMGSDMKDKTCASCGTMVEKLSLGGGQVYFCAKCQK